MKLRICKHPVLFSSSEDDNGQEMPEPGLSAVGAARSGAASFAEALERVALLWVVALSVALLWRAVLHVTVGEVMLTIVFKLL